MRKWLLFCTVNMMALSLLTMSCKPKEDAGTLMVERQVCFLKHYTHLQENESDLDIIVDLPVQGPKVLVDSITQLFNEQLYSYFSDEDDTRLPYESVFSTDTQHLLEHYREAFRPYFDEDSTYICEFETHCLEMNMVAQTASYVTYEIVNVYFGEGLEEARSWVTFAKSDGHRVQDVITTESMIRFYQENPDERDNDVWGHIQYKLDNSEMIHLDNVGLLNETLSICRSTETDKQKVIPS